MEPSPRAGSYERAADLLLQNSIRMSEKNTVNLHTAISAVNMKIELLQFCTIASSWKTAQFQQLLILLLWSVHHTSLCGILLMH